MTDSSVLIISVIITAHVTVWHMFSVAALFLVCFCKLDILSYQHDREMYWWWQTKYNIFLQNKQLLSSIQKKRVTCEYCNNLSGALCVGGVICKRINFVIFSHSVWVCRTLPSPPASIIGHSVFNNISYRQNGQSIY